MYQVGQVGYGISSPAQIFTTHLCWSSSLSELLHTDHGWAAWLWELLHWSRLGRLALGTPTRITAGPPGCRSSWHLSHPVVTSVWYFTTDSPTYPVLSAYQRGWNVHFVHIRLQVISGLNIPDAGHANTWMSTAVSEYLGFQYGIPDATVRWAQLYVIIIILQWLLIGF